MSSPRRKIRVAAVEIIFEAAQRKKSPLTILESREGIGDREYHVYSRKIVNGVASHQSEIDEIISTHARGWTLERMPAMDLAIVRVGVWELLYEDALDDPIVISEATSIAAEYSTDNSPNFVNGLLDRISKVKDLYV